MLKPAAQAYRYVVPEPVRTGVHNVLANLGTPVVLSNDMMQGKPRRAGDTTMRFLINTTVGVVGVFDFAKNWGYPAARHGFRHDPRAVGRARRVRSCSCRCWGRATRGTRWASA